MWFKGGILDPDKTNERKHRRCCEEGLSCPERKKERRELEKMRKFRGASSRKNGNPSQKRKVLSLQEFRKKKIANTRQSRKTHEAGKKK